MATTDDVSRHAVPLSLGGAAVGLGILLLAAAVGLIDGPTTLIARAGYAAAAVALMGFGWVFVARALVDLVRIGTLRAIDPERGPGAEAGAGSGTPESESESGGDPDA